jgi:hypothetical protein
MREKMRITALLLAAMASGYVGGLMSQVTTKAATVGKAPAVSKVVRANKFELVDSAGKVRGTFEVKNNSSGLWLNDSSGKLRATFSAHNNGAGLWLSDSSGKLRGVFCAYNSGSSLMLYDSAGRNSVTLQVSKTGPGLWFYNNVGKTIWTAP